MVQSVFAGTINDSWLAPSGPFYSHFENMQPLLHFASANGFLKNLGVVRKCAHTDTH